MDSKTFLFFSYLVVCKRTQGFGPILEGQQISCNNDSNSISPTKQKRFNKKVHMQFEFHT